VSFCVLFVCKCVLYYCHRVTTQLQLINISYHIITHLVQPQNISHEQQVKMLDCMTTYHFMMNYVEGHNDQPHIKFKLAKFPTKFVKFTYLLN